MKPRAVCRFCLTSAAMTTGHVRYELRRHTPQDRHNAGAIQWWLCERCLRAIERSAETLATSGFFADLEASA